MFPHLLETPCFILDQEELERSIDGFNDGLSQCLKKHEIGYSVKTNATPYCLGVALAKGCFAEVVSEDEYHQARLCGFATNRIIYNGPMKSRDTFLEAIKGGAVVNLETKRELVWLQELPQDKVYNVGIRLNINITHVSPDDADGDNDNSRFGFSDETGEFADAISALEGLTHVRLAGIHIHRTAHSRSVRFYENSLRFACKTIEKYKLQLDYIDIGGGYFGIFPNKPTYQHYAQAFKNVLSEFGMDSLCVIVEPGNALVASCFDFLSEVIDVKHVEEDRWFLTTDGSRNDIDPFYRKSNYMTEIFFKDDTSVRIKVDTQIVSGCTCLEYDRLFTISNSALLECGDRILYKNVGAYTICLSPLFIRYFPNIYVKTAGGFKLIREKWGAMDFMTKSIISL